MHARCSARLGGILFGIAVVQDLKVYCSRFGICGAQLGRAWINFYGCGARQEGGITTTPTIYVYMVVTMDSALFMYGKLSYFVHYYGALRWLTECGQTVESEADSPDCLIEVYSLEFSP